MIDGLQRDDGVTWLAAVLGITCIEHGMSRMQYTDLFKAVQRLSKDKAVPFSVNEPLDDGYIGDHPLPGFYESLLKARTYGVETDGEFGEYVFVNALTAEKILSRIATKMGPGYMDVARRHAKLLLDALQRDDTGTAQSKPFPNPMR